MPKIKTREKVQGIKTLDKAAVAGERMKEVCGGRYCSCCCGWCKTGSEKRNSGNQAAQGTICGTDAGAGDAQSAMG